MLVAHIQCWSAHFCLVSSETAPFLTTLILQPPPHFSLSLFLMSHVREQLLWKASIMAGCIVACVVSEGAGTPQCPPAQEAQTLTAWQLNAPFLPFQSPSSFASAFVSTGSLSASDNIKPDQNKTILVRELKEPNTIHPSVSLWWKTNIKDPY